MKDVKVTIRIDTRTWEKIEALAKSDPDDKGISHAIRKVIRSGLQPEKGRQKLRG